MSNRKFPNALQPDYMLHWYRIREVLGQGAFGITYLAEDVNLDRSVAVKEYMPGQLCTRDSDQSIQPLSEELLGDFNWGLTRFINEARTLTRFEHPNLVRVLNVFEMNNTAYMVMNYETGRSLQQILKQKTQLHANELMQILVPLMNGLELMHAKGFIHRDIKPGNIFIRDDGSPVLLDFGSARQTRGRGAAHTLTNFVSPGYAPIEQYTSKSDRQGPWTDIYGLGATLYRAITGVSPTSAVDRSEMLMSGKADDYRKLIDLAGKDYPESILSAIDHALAFNAEDRPRNIDEWRREFGFESPGISGSATAGATAEEYGGQTQNPGNPDNEKTLELNLDPGTVPISEEPPAEATTVNIAGETGTDVHTIALSLRGHARRFLTKPHAVLGGLLVIIAVIVIVAGRGGVQSGEHAAVPSSTAGQAGLAPAETGSMAADMAAGEAAMSEVESPDKPDGTVSKDNDKSGIINSLLTGADRDIRALRLTTPTGNNAHDKYRKVLQLDPENPEAIWGLKRIAARYVQLAHGSMDSGHTGRAHRYLENAEQLDPSSPGLDRAREQFRALSAQQTETASSSGFLDDVRGWFKGNSGEDGYANGGSSSSEKVKRALGGR